MRRVPQVIILQKEEPRYTLCPTIEEFACSHIQFLYSYMAKRGSWQILPFVVIHNLTHDKFCELFDVSFRFEVITATFLQISVCGTYTATALTTAASVFEHNRRKQKATTDISRSPQQT